MDGNRIRTTSRFYFSWETFALQAIVLLLVLAEIVTTETRRYTGKRKNAS